MAQAKITVVGEDLASEVLKNVGSEVEKTGKKVADTSINFGHLKKALEDLAPETEHAAGGLVVDARGGRGRVHASGRDHQARW
jgi:hypothetical protein